LIKKTECLNGFASTKKNSDDVNKDSVLEAKDTIPPTPAKIKATTFKAKAKAKTK